MEGCGGGGRHVTFVFCAGDGDCISAVLCQSSLLSRGMAGNWEVIDCLSQLLNSLLSVCVCVAHGSGDTTYEFYNQRYVSARHYFIFISVLILRLILFALFFNLVLFLVAIFFPFFIVCCLLHSFSLFLDLFSILIFQF